MENNPAHRESDLSLEVIMAMEQWPERLEAVLATLTEMVESERVDIGPEVYEQQDSLPSDNWLLEKDQHHKLYNRKNGEELYYYGNNLTERWLKKQDEHGRPTSSLRSGYDGKRTSFGLSYETWHYLDGDNDYRITRGVRSDWNKSDEEVITQNLRIYWVEPAFLIKPYYVPQASGCATSRLQAAFINDRLAEAHFSRYKACNADNADGDPTRTKDSERHLYTIGAKWGEGQSAEATIKEKGSGGEITSLTIVRDSRGRISYSFQQKADSNRLAA